jgi:hypothetical protein
VSNPFAVFKNLEDQARELNSDLMLQKLVYVACQLGVLLYITNRFGSMGLLPTSASDWLGSVPIRTPAEYVPSPTRAMPWVFLCVVGSSAHTAGPSFQGKSNRLTRHGIECFERGPELERRFAAGGFPLVEWVFAPQHDAELASKRVCER